MPTKPVIIAAVMAGLLTTPFASGQESKTEVQQNTQHVQSLVSPGYPDALVKPPEWAGDEVPFNIHEYLGPSPDENAATLYFDALFEFDENMYYCFPDLREAVLAAEERQNGAGKLVLQSVPRYQATKIRRKRFDDFLDQVDWEFHKIEPQQFEELEQIIEEYAGGIAKIELAQQRDQCAFPTTIDGISGEHAFAGRDTAYVLLADGYLRLQQDEVGKTINRIKTTLRLTTDWQRRADLIFQLSAAAPERLCCEWLMRPLLAHKELTSEQCDRLISIFTEQRYAVDPIIEADRYNYLFLRNILDLLERGEYTTRERAEDFSREISMAGPLLLRELVDNNFYRLNSAEIGKRVFALADQNPEIAEALKNISPDEDVLDSIDRMLVSLFAWQELDGMAAEDYRIEVAVLNKRYKQLVAAGQLPYPQRIQALDQLDSHWTTDESWKKATILRLFSPQEISTVARTYQNAELRRHAMLCLIALTRWRLNSVQEPQSLKQLVEAAGMSAIPTDPFSGSALKMAKVDGQIVIYSVGPDGDDDLGKRPLELRVYGDPRDGDFVFKVEMP